MNVKSHIMAHQSTIMRYVKIRTSKTTTSVSHVKHVTSSLDNIKQHVTHARRQRVRNLFPLYRKTANYSMCAHWHTHRTHWRKSPKWCCLVTCCHSEHTQTHTKVIKIPLLKISFEGNLNLKVKISEFFSANS